MAGDQDDDGDDDDNGDDGDDDDNGDDGDDDGVLIFRTVTRLSAWVSPSTSQRT